MLAPAVSKACELAYLADFRQNLARNPHLGAFRLARSPGILANWVARKGPRKISVTSNELAASDLEIPQNNRVEPT
jgi:hypothetical protein